MPFRDNEEERTQVWHWLERFWDHHFSDDTYEIVEGHDYYWPFSKSAAVNEAARRARGDVFVVLDADAWMDPCVIARCCSSVLRALHKGRRLWYVPYRNLYRFNDCATEWLLGRDPWKGYDLSSPPPEWMIERDVNHPGYGHLYGAMALIMPREAFELVHGMDPRFRGWGGEDASFMRALDTLYCQHEVTSNDVIHVHHVRPGQGFTKRQWVGQTITNVNQRLAQRYSSASNDPTLMRALISEQSEQ